MKCELCELEVDKITKHHLVPKQKGGRRLPEKLAKVCVPCSKQIHALFTNSELKRFYDTIEKLKSNHRVRKWIAWRQKHPVTDIKYSGKEGGRRR